MFVVLIGSLPLWPDPKNKSHGVNRDFTETILLVLNAQSTSQENG